jgi:hypothetical protein
MIGRIVNVPFCWRKAIEQYPIRRLHSGRSYSSSRGSLLGPDPQVKEADPGGRSAAGMSSFGD